MAKIRRAGPAPTKASGTGTFSMDRMVKNWDQRAGLRQATDRVETRVAQGNKMTPRGRGTLQRK